MTHLVRRGKRFSVFLVSLAVLALVLAACGSSSSSSGGASSGSKGAAPQGVTDSTIKIGAFGPLTGVQSWIGLGAKAGMELAVDQINDHGGINGRKIDLTFVGASSPADSLAAARQLIQDDKVYALVTGGGSTGAAAVAAYARKVKIPTYTLLGATPLIREPFAQNIFHGTAPSAGTLSEFLVKQLKDLKPTPKRVGLISGTYAYPASEQKAVMPLFEKNGLNLVATATYDQGDTDYTAQLTKMRQANVDAILFLGEYPEGVLLLRQASQGGLKNVKWVVDSASAVPELPKDAGSAAEGTVSYYVMPYYPNSTAKPMTSYLKAWKAKYGNPPKDRPNYVDLAGYGDMFNLATVIKRAGDDLSWTNLIATWEKATDLVPSDFADWASDVTFPESFSATNHQGNRCMETLKVQSGEWAGVGKICDPSINDLGN